ncbi:hypothetical protein, partial [Mesorhizobium sp. M7A.F.Ca.CA.001.07.2.1]|uniref:hypothetical protein n=1 Tax=Mesorhizobium sp. M7A.F.Ca.CA.001.07.2.1 TaxID=2496684 RepID=UPI0019D44805
DAKRPVSTRAEEQMTVCLHLEKALPKAVRQLTEIWSQEDRHHQVTGSVDMRLGEISRFFSDLRALDVVSPVCGSSFHGLSMDADRA